MNMIELNEPPANMSDYIKAPEKKTIEEFEKNLRELIKKGTANIATGECCKATIISLEKEIAANGYKVQYVQIQGKPAFADFYLNKF